MCRTSRTRNVYLEERNINEYYHRWCVEKQWKDFFVSRPLLSSMYNLLSLPSSFFFVILFHCCCSYAEVLGTTFVHECHIPIAIQNVTCFYHETRWSLLIQKINLSKTNYNNNYKCLPLRYIFLLGFLSS